MHVAVNRMVGRMHCTDTMDQTGSGPGSVVVDVVEAVATETNADPATMEPPLQTVIDAEALERLVGGSTVSRVTFEYDGHTVVVDGDGAVSVDAATHERPAALETAGRGDAAADGIATAQLEDDGSLEELQ